MLRRSTVVLCVIIAACTAGASGIEPSSTAPSSSSTTTTTLAPTTTETAPSTTAITEATTPTSTLPAAQESLLYDHWLGSFTYGPEDIRIDVHAPEERSNHPIAITIHGGGWYGGRLDSMGQLADGLAARGFVVFNATYRTLARGGDFPSMVEDVACAVAHARDHALDYSTDDSSFTIIGHSAGAHLASLVALSPGTFGAVCPIDGVVDDFVGLAGSYDTDAYAFLLEPFFGVALTDDPELWASGNPLRRVVDADPDLDVLLVHGTVDQLVPVSMSESFLLALEPHVRTARLSLLADAGHGEVNAPRLVGDLIAEFVAGQ